MYVVRVRIYREFAASGQRVLATSRPRDLQHADDDDDDDLELFGVCDDFFKKDTYYIIFVFRVFSKSQPGRLRNAHASRPVAVIYEHYRRARCNRDSVGGKHARDAYPTSCRYLLIPIYVTEFTYTLLLTYLRNITRVYTAGRPKPSTGNDLVDFNLTKKKVYNINFIPGRTYEYVIKKFY